MKNVIHVSLLVGLVIFAFSPRVVLPFGHDCVSSGIVAAFADSKDNEDADKGEDNDKDKDKDKENDNDDKHAPSASEIPGALMILTAAVAIGGGYLIRKRLRA